MQLWHFQIWRTHISIAIAEYNTVSDIHYLQHYFRENPYLILSFPEIFGVWRSDPTSPQAFSIYPHVSFTSFQLYTFTPLHTLTTPTLLHLHQTSRRDKNSLRIFEKFQELSNLGDAGHILPHHLSSTRSLEKIGDSIGYIRRNREDGKASDPAFGGDWEVSPYFILQRPSCSISVYHKSWYCQRMLIYLPHDFGFLSIKSRVS